MVVFKLQGGILGVSGERVVDARVSGPLNTNSLICSINNYFLGEKSMFKEKKSLKITGLNKLQEYQKNVAQ